MPRPDQEKAGTNEEWKWYFLCENKPNFFGNINFSDGFHLKI